ncbi:MAG: hypothetical protein JXB04_03875 [Kiritimatiellae bacterium]|nr:hypothetical protein [Kiritimatiellia bacterium]
MLGIHDPWVALVYILCILSSLLCVVWGILRWNREGAPDEPAEEVKHWAEEEDKVEEEL